MRRTVTRCGAARDFSWEDPSRPAKFACLPTDGAHRSGPGRLKTSNASVRRTAFVLYQNRRVLVVELRHGADAAAADELLRHLAWAHIDSIHVVPNIPVDRRHNAKVDYPALQALLDQ